MTNSNADGRSKNSRQELIIQPISRRQKQFESFLQQLDAEGIGTVYADPKKMAQIKSTKKNFKTMFTTPDADYVIMDGQKASHGKPGSKTFARRQENRQQPAGSSKARKKTKNGMRFKITSNQDIENILDVSAKLNLDFVIVDVADWKIIPLENVIARLHKMHTKIIALARTPVEVRKMFSILDVGVDGVIFATSSISQVRETLLYMGSKQFKMTAAEIIEIKEIGDGERVCVDTASMLDRGEGMLIGSRSNFMFLVHNESVGSSFTSPRPFRVNAGAVHCYTPSPDGTTKYLSEIETGSEVMILTPEGRARRAAVGRSKIERRPMLVIKAEADGEIGGIIAQDAETIRFVKSGKKGELVSVTHLKKGDKVMAHVRKAAGRHFGMEVKDEYILEK